MKNFERIAAAIGGDQPLRVIENLPVSANGFFLSEEQMDLVEATIQGNDAALTTATANEAAAVATAATATADLATANTRITELEAQVVKLENADGTQGANAEAIAQDEFEKQETVDPMAFAFQKEILERIN